VDAHDIGQQEKDEIMQCLFCKKELKYHAVRIVSMISIALISMPILFPDF